MKWCLKWMVMSLSKTTGSDCSPNVSLLSCSQEQSTQPLPLTSMRQHLCCRLGHGYMVSFPLLLLHAELPDPSLPISFVTLCHLLVLGLRFLPDGELVYWLLLPSCFPFNKHNSSLILTEKEMY